MVQINKIHEIEITHLKKKFKAFYYQKKLNLEPSLSADSLQEIFGNKFSIQKELREKIINSLYKLHLRNQMSTKHKILFALLIMGPSKLSNIYFFFKLNFKVDENNEDWCANIRYNLTTLPVFKNEKRETSSIWLV